MSGTIPVVVSDYLSGAVPGAALVVHSEVPTDFSDYYVAGDGALFAVGNDLYVTDSALNAAVSESGEVVRIVDGGTLISGETLTNYISLTTAISDKKSNILLVGFSSSGVNYSPGNRTIIGIKDSTIADFSGSTSSALSDSGTTKLYGLTIANNSRSDTGGSVKVDGGTTWIGKSVFSGNSTTGSSKAGGAVGTTSKTAVIIVDSFFGENRSVNAGAGAVYANGPLLVVSGSTFNGNHAQTYCGAIYSNASTTVITGSTFVGNISEASSNHYGGALGLLKGGTIVDKTVFYGNVGNNVGGAVSLNGGTSFISGVTFSENTAKSGGGGYVYSGSDVSITDTLFADNTATTYGGALYNLGTLSISGSTFSGNTATTYGGALYLGGGAATITGAVSFQTDTDTIYVKSGASLTVLDAQLALNASLNQGAANLTGMTNSTVLFGNTSAIAFDKTVTLGDNVTLKFTGDASVGFAPGQTAPAAVVIDKDYAVGTTVVATGLTGLTGYTRGGTAHGFDYWGLKAGETGLVEYVSYSGNTLGATVTDTITIGDGTGAAKVADFDFALADDFTGHYLVAGDISLNSDALPNELSSVTNNAVITVDGASFIGEGENYARALTVSNYAGTGSVAVTDPTQYYAYTDDAGIVVVKGTTAGLVTFDGSTPGLLNAEEEYYFGQNYSTFNAARSKESTVVLQGQTVTARLGNLSDGKTVVLDNLYGQGIETSSNGSIIYSGNGNDRYINIYGGTFVGNHTTGNAGVVGMQGGGELNINPHTEVVAGQTVTRGTLFINNWAEGRAGAVDCTGRTNITGATFSGNRSDNAGPFYGGAVYISSVVTITDCVFDGNYNTADGAAVYVNSGTLTLRGSTFLTATDYIYNWNGTVNVSGRNVLNASFSGNQGCNINVADADFVFGNTAAIDVAGLTFSGSNAMTFNGSETVNFTVSGGQDLSDVAITVDGSAYAGSEIVVATGVSAIGSYTVTGADDLTLYTAGGKMVLSEVSNTMSGGTTANFVGGTSNLMTGGTVTVAFFGTRNASGGVRTVFTGGTVVNSMVAGALVQAKDAATAALDTVSVDIYDGVSLLGGTANGGMNYVAGYAYGRTGWTELPKEANYTVQSAVLNLSGSSINGNLYAGAHARKYAYTGVAATTVNVTGGIVEKLYGGGWAERGDKSITGGTAALSTVGTATVNISGGSINRLYAGGGNSYYGYTEVGTANLTISGGTVDFVFLGGKNNNCFVDNATLTITGDAQKLTRVSGKTDSGVDNTGSAILNVQTDVTLGYLDYVDRINIAEACTLNITDWVLYDDISQELSVYLGTDGFDGTWDIFSATNARDIDTLAEAQFYLVGGSMSYTMGDTIEIAGGSYRLNKTQSGLGIALSKIG